MTAARPAVVPFGASHRQLPSILAEELELGHHALATIAPDGAALGLGVVDRKERPFSRFDLAEVRLFAGSAVALGREARDAPFTLASDHPRATFTVAASAEAGPISAVLTKQERRVAALMVEGRTNPETAAALVISRDTVKTHVRPHPAKDRCRESGSCRVTSRRTTLVATTVWPRRG